MAAILGGTTDATGAHIDVLARFAVDDHNIRTGAALKYRKVISATEKIVEGVEYDIILEAIDGELIHKYETKVWEKRWEYFLKVVEFKLVRDAADAPPSVSTT